MIGTFPLCCLLNVPTPISLKHRAQGFTAIELMVCVAILAVLTAIALPAFKGMIERWRVNQYLGEFESTIYKSRSEAIKRSGNIFIQKYPNNATCDRATTMQDWGCGWFIYYSPTRTSPYNGTDEIVQEYPASKNTTMTLLFSSAGINTLAVSRWGTIGGINALSITAGPVLGNTESVRNQSKLCLASGGRITILKDDPTCPSS